MDHREIRLVFACESDEQTKGKKEERKEADRGGQRSGDGVEGGGKCRQNRIGVTVSGFVRRLDQNTLQNATNPSNVKRDRPLHFKLKG